MKRTLTATLLACGSLGCASQRTTPPAEPGWSIYRNAKYGYEIAYPDGYEVRPARREGERDARRIRIGLKEYAAPTPVLDIELDPADSFYELGRRKTLKDMRLEVVDLELGGRPARQVVFRWVSTDEIAFVEIHQEGALLRFQAPPGLEKFEGTVWWKIAFSFERRPPAPGRRRKRGDSAAR